MNELTDFGNRLEKVADPAARKRMLTKAGEAGKKAARQAAEQDLGGDRAMRNYRGGRSRLDAGFDVVGDAAKINFRPAGMWKLASEGRRSGGVILPRRGRAVMTPRGPRARSSYGPSRGKGTLKTATNEAQREVPKAVARQFHDEVAKVVRG